MPFAGNSGGRPREDKLVPGSPEAIEADKRKEAERSRRRREEAKAARLAAGQAPTLPPVAANTPGQTPAPAAGVGDMPGVAVECWLPSDFNQAAVDSVNLADTWNVNRKTKKMVEGKLPRLVVEEISRDVAFPKEAKLSLQTSSPAGLAKLFNALKIPLAFKPVVSGCPALIWIILRDFQIDAKIDKLIADEAARQRAATTAAAESQPKP